jgi:nitrogen regulatory protein P-II 1
MEFQLVICLVKADFTDQIIRVAKKAGAGGSTVIAAQGTGVHEAKTFFGLDLNLQTDAILFFLEASLVDPVLEAINKVCNMDNPGTGIAIVVPVLKAIGIAHQISHFERMQKHPQATGSKPDPSPSRHS